MKTLKIPSFVTLLALAACCVAQTAMVRYDVQGPFSTGLSLGLEDRNGVGLYALFLDSSYPEYDFGQMRPVTAGRDGYLLAGAYASYFPGKLQGNGLAVQPWLIGEVRVGKAAFHLNLGVNVPISNAPLALMSNDASVLGRCSPTVQFGFGATYWNPTGGAQSLRYGPKLKIRLDSRSVLSVAGYAWGSKQPDIRVQLTRTF